MRVTFENKDKPLEENILLQSGDFEMTSFYGGDLIYLNWEDDWLKLSKEEFDDIYVMFDFIKKRLDG